MTHLLNIETGQGMFIHGDGTVGATSDFSRVDVGEYLCKMNKDYNISKPDENGFVAITKKEGV